MDSFYEGIMEIFFKGLQNRCDIFFCNFVVDFSYLCFREGRIVNGEVRFVYGEVDNYVFEVFVVCF